jgi:glycosyltransferase 2 family protein
LKKLVVNILKYLGFLSLGVFLFWLSFRKLNLTEVWNEIREANYYWVALALIFVLISHFFRSLRWNLLINSMGYKTRFSTTFYALMVGYMANTAVPRMGEFMRCGVLARKEKIPFNALFGTVISERLFDLVILFLLLLVVVVTQWGLLGEFVLRMTGPFTASIISNLTVLIILAVALLIIFAGLLYGYIKYRKKLNHLPGYKRTHDLITGLAQGVRTIDRMKQKGLFLLYTVFIWFFYILMMYVPFFMLPETSDLDFMAGVTLLAIGSLGIVAPVPGGIGAYHFIAKAVLTELYAISGNAAGSFAVITHAAQTLLNVLAGAFGYLVLFFLDHKPPRNEKA